MNNYLVGQATDNNCLSLQVVKDEGLAATNPVWDARDKKLLEKRKIFKIN